MGVGQSAFWQRRYDEQHRTLQRMEDELAETRAAARDFAETLGVIARGDARERDDARGERLIHRELAQTALVLRPEFSEGTSE
jgi:hypothetical protein